MKKVKFSFDKILYFQLQEWNYLIFKKTKLFDTESNKWSHGPEMNSPRYGHGCVRIEKTSQQKSQILVVGGCEGMSIIDSTIESRFIGEDIESLVIGEDKWKVVGRTDLKGGLYKHVLTVSHNPKYIAYSIGGLSESGLDQKLVKPIYGIKDDFLLDKVGELEKPREDHQSLNLLRNEIPNCV